MDPFLGQIILWPVPWVPAGWTLCDGKLLSIQTYNALYSLLGVVYGGDGTSTFGIPDLRGLIPMGSQSMAQVNQKQGALSNTVQAPGSGSLMLSLANLPPHSHAASFWPSGGTATANIAIPAVANPSAASVSATPGQNMSLAEGQTQGPDPFTIYSSDDPDTSLKPFTISVPSGGGSVSIGSTGQGTPASVSVITPVTMSTLQPSLTLNFIMAVEGIYPPRP